jgi:ATP-dependent protease ClpP protease subunit
MSETPREPTDEEKARWAALARKYEAEAEHAEHLAAIARLDLDAKNREAIRAGYADDYEDRTYRLLSAIDDASVSKCIKQLDAWHRGDPDCRMTIIFDSPGGAVIPGFHLFDHILALRESHEINTVSRGYAASMAGILLQVGQTRTMGRNAHLMIHEVSFGAQGKIGDVEDGVEFAKLLWNRALDIFADRCKESAATKKLSRSQLVSRSKRKNWWIKATDALAYGLVDEVA